MSTILKNVVRFTGLVVGVPTSLPHLLNKNGLPEAPRLGAANAPGFTITADATNVTVTRTLAAPVADVDVYVEIWHSYEEALPLPGKLVGLTPFIFSGGGGGAVNPWTTSALKGTDFGAAWTYNPVTARMQSTGVGRRLVTLDLSVGEHLTGLDFQVAGDGVADVTATVFFVNAAGVIANIGTLVVTDPAAMTIASIPVADTALTANGAFFVEFSANAANIEIGNIEATRYIP